MNCIITGATKGIGRAILEKLAKEGANVAFCARNQVDVEQTIVDLKKEFPTIQIIGESVDMSKKEAVKAFGKKILSQWNKIDILVNNVGVYKEGWVTTEEEGTLELQMETNVYSAYYMTRAILSAMQPFQSGHIFNICSIASLEMYAEAHSYSVSKFAMLGLSKAQRKELKGDGIKVTAILPGATWSAAWGNAPISTERLTAAADIAQAIWATYQLPATAVVEEMVIRPQLGDL